jgi:hypothetical protein
VKMWNGFLSLRIGYSFRHFRNLTTYIEFHKTIGVSWIVQLLFASETWFWSTETVNYTEKSTISFVSSNHADSGGRAEWDVGMLLLLTCWTEDTSSAESMDNWNSWVSSLSGRVFCFRPITHPEESNGVRCVWVWSWGLEIGEALVL